MSVNNRTKTVPLFEQPTNLWKCYKRSFTITLYTLNYCRHACDGTKIIWRI